MKHPNTETQYGIASGFPPCCVAYYLLRSKVNKWIFKDDIVKYNTLMNSIYAKIGEDYNHWQHIPCPAHKVLSICGLYKPKYHHCDECGWMQLGKAECNLASLHETEVRSRIREHILYLKKEYSFVYYCPTTWGRIGEEIANEINYVRLD